MKFKEMKFKEWNSTICAIVIIVCAVLKLFFHFKAAIPIALTSMAWLFFVEAFVKVKRAKPNLSE